MGRHYKSQNQSQQPYDYDYDYNQNQGKSYDKKGNQAVQTGKSTKVYRPKANQGCDKTQESSVDVKNIVKDIIKENEMDAIKRILPDVEKVITDCENVSLQSMNQKAMNLDGSI